jgi:hypothetical protein
MMATRLYTPERFSMTAGVNVPFDLALSSVSGSALKRPTGAFLAHRRRPERVASDPIRPLSSPRDESLEVERVQLLTDARL